MDEDEYEYDEEEVELLCPARPFAKIDVLVLAVGFVADVAQVVASTLSQAHGLVAMHGNHLIARERFHEEAARELETMLEGEDG